MWGALPTPPCPYNPARITPHTCMHAPHRTLGASGVSLISGAKSLYISSGVMSRPASAGTTEACRVRCRKRGRARWGTAAAASAPATAGVQGERRVRNLRGGERVAAAVLAAISGNGQQRRQQQQRSP